MLQNRSGEPRVEPCSFFANHPNTSLLLSPGNISISCLMSLPWIRFGSSSRNRLIRSIESIANFMLIFVASSKMRGTEMKRSDPAPHSTETACIQRVENFHSLLCTLNIFRCRSFDSADIFFWSMEYIGNLLLRHPSPPVS